MTVKNWKNFGKKRQTGIHSCSLRINNAIILTSLQHLPTCPLVKQGLNSPDMVCVMIINDTIAHFMATAHVLHYYTLPYIIMWLCWALNNNLHSVYHLYGVFIIYGVSWCSNYMYRCLKFHSQVCIVMVIKIRCI